MTHSLIDGYDTLQGILDRLAQHPDKLDEDRLRFDSTPSVLSSIRSSIPNSPIDPEVEFENKIDYEWRMTSAHFQWDAQVGIEFARMEESEKYQDAQLRLKRPFVPQGQHDISFLAARAHWIEQGLWNFNWDVPNGYNGPMPNEPWPNEEDERDKDVQERKTVPQADFFSRYLAMEQEGGAYEQALQKRRARDASRPLQQFIYQVNIEREWMEQWKMAEVNINKVPEFNPESINHLAYLSVKKRWQDHNLWDKSWGILPGMRWKHQIPFEEFLETQRKLPRTVPPTPSPRGDTIWYGAAQQFGGVTPASLRHSYSPSRGSIDSYSRHNDSVLRASFDSYGPQFPPRPYPERRRSLPRLRHRVPSGRWSLHGEWFWWGRSRKAKSPIYQLPTYDQEKPAKACAKQDEYVRPEDASPESVSAIPVVAVPVATEPTPSEPLRDGPQAPTSNRPLSAVSKIFSSRSSSITSKRSRLFKRWKQPRDGEGRGPLEVRLLNYKISIMVEGVGR